MCVCMIASLIMMTLPTLVVDSSSIRGRPIATVYVTFNQMQKQ